MEIKIKVSDLIKIEYKLKKTYVLVEAFEITKQWHRTSNSSHLLSSFKFVISLILLLKTNFY